MQKTLIILFFLAVSLFSQMGFVSAAETNVDYTPLVSLPGVAKSDGTITLQTYIPGVFKLSIGIAGVLAVLMIVFGGFEYITSESLGGKSDGKERINNALIGLLLVIGSYAILSTISPDLLSFNLNVKSLPTQQTGGGAISGNATSTSTGGNWPDDATERKKIEGILEVNRTTTCKKVGEDPCTSLAGIGDRVLNGLIQLKNTCKTCTVTITGGTEYWLHGNRNQVMGLNPTKHKPGGNAVDISLNGGVLTFFRNNPQYKTNETGCTEGTERYRFMGGLYVNETINGQPPPKGAHFHVCF